MERRTEKNWWLRTGRNGTVPPVAVLCFLFAAVGAHLVFALLIRIKTPQVETLRVQGRTNKIIRADNPAFRAYCASLPRESDPTVFIRGGGNLGYSRFLMRSEKEELDAASSVRPSLSPETETVFSYPCRLPETLRGISGQERLYADLLAAMMPAEKPVPALPVHYPVWSDAHGVIRELRNDRSEAQWRKMFVSRDVTGPTCLRIVFRNIDGFPPTAEIFRSSGSPVLDFYAKHELDGFLAKPENAARFDSRYNDLVKVFWNAKAPVVQADSGMEALFGKDGGK